MSDGSIGEKRPRSHAELCKRLSEALTDELLAVEEYQALAAGAMEIRQAKRLEEIAGQEDRHRCVVQELLNELCPCTAEGPK